LCPICDASFTKSYSLKQHIAIHEANPTALQCQECDFVATSKSRLQDHQAAHSADSQSPGTGNSLEEAHFTFMESVEDDDDVQEFRLEEIQTY
jgi:hypothetical protein